MNEKNLEILKQIIDIVYPIQQKKLVVHFRDVKRQLMKIFQMNRWNFDDFLMKFMRETFDGGLNAFYLMKCGSYAGSRLSYVSYAPRKEKATFSNSFCFISIDKRNKYVQNILETPSSLSEFALERKEVK